MEPDQQETEQASKSVLPVDDFDSTPLVKPDQCNLDDGPCESCQ